MLLMENQSRIALRVSYTTIAANAALSAVKLLAGLLARSGAMVSDAVHSMSDVVSTVVVIIGVRAAGKASDREHPYGHERMECVAAIVLSVMLLLTGLYVGMDGISKILSSGRESLQPPGALALWAAVLSIGVKEGMYHYTRSAARKIDSNALMADAWHHRSDALSSIGALIGIGGALLGAPVMDPIASLSICLMILKAAYDIFRDAIDKMVDQSCDEQTQEAIVRCALAHPGVQRVDSILSRKFGSRIYVEMEISMDGALPLSQAHAAAEQVHRDIEAAFPKVKHIMIHVNPAGEEPPVTPPS